MRALIMASYQPQCLRTHWDPTRVSQHILPSASNAPQMLDPRPAAFICTSYYSTSPGDGPLPPQTLPSAPVIPTALLGGSYYQSPPPPSHVMPPGGAARTGFPYAGYAQNVGRESDLLRLDEPLTRCAAQRFLGPPAVNSGLLGGNPTNSASYAAVKFPDTCRAQEDAAAEQRSPLQFMNATRYDRTKTLRQ
jgi:hypothetical protein